MQYACRYLNGKTILTIAGDEDQPMGLCGVRKRWLYMVYDLY